MLAKFTQRAFRSPKLAAQQEKDRCPLCDRSPRIMMKSPAGSRSISVEIDGRMFPIPGTSVFGKVLFPIAAPRI